ncbi:hypothetical protein CEUSTIGMA_g10293.t1 [Chlamydomonas eustigma]|uniref:isopentenyl-diphosphate Delta-isomerase n=1 Tax=Chlamydomonas eustigma TaxID=1157962 RepID=A0A250XIF0_9CHLO|nr:hypothetical protein CEUSTIGMA_g10293.t1 [Chlamydomonas eustigma]|eukprot:GAX82867.1 hypothetical protein CEUSTIGMA_g10293.t1 [Chlamydomonas eustigma]
MSTWTGSGTQEDFMRRDECILVDENDCIVGHSNKYDCHRFVPGQPQGLLHRAFSVFLFNSEGHLLLQQRAKGKVTFPLVWTNTCCSHPLYGQTPDEVDTDEGCVLDGSVLGIKHAAIRKLQHELGIPANELSLDSFRFLTRLHYCAADKATWGPMAEWGEHEMDYILFIQVPKVTLNPNPEEVEAIRYVGKKELFDMMQLDSRCSWSPWFKIIADRLLPKWYFCRLYS